MYPFLLNLLCWFLVLEASIFLSKESVRFILALTLGEGYSVILSSVRSMSLFKCSASSPNPLLRLQLFPLNFYIVAEL